MRYTDALTRESHREASLSSAPADLFRYEEMRCDLASETHQNSLHHYQLFCGGSV